MMTRSTEIFAQIQPVLAGVRPEDFAAVCSRVLAARRVFLLGAGQTGLVLRGLAMRLTQAGITAYIPGDCTVPAIGPDDLLLAASSGGRRPGVVALTQAAVSTGAPVTLITASADSPLAQLADQILILPSSPLPGEGGAPLLLGTRFELSLFCLCILFAEELVRRLGLDESSLRRRHANLE